MFGLGATEILLILVVALLVLGPKRLPDAARSLGRGIAEFRRASNDLRTAITMPLDEPEPGLRSPAIPAEAKRPAPAASPAAPAPSPTDPPASRPEPPASDV